jgi:mannose-6-phosphate isomerase-like protein (cupin superfamily)
MTPETGRRPELAFENPESGERIVLHPDAPAAGGRVLTWELFLAPGGRVPSTHAHPGQEERFTVREGRLRFRVGARRITAGPGETVVVPPGTVHRFSNPGGLPAHATVETRPPLAMAALLGTAAAMARERQARRRRLPFRPGDLLELALFMEEFGQEVRAPYLPAAPVRRAVAALAGLARALGRDDRYRRLRTRT